MPVGEHPTYSNPPCIERVLGVQFDPIPQLTAGLIGKYWSTMDQSVWPISRDADYLQPQIEEFGESIPNLNALRFHFSQRVNIRVQFQSEQNDRLIQIQNDRFHFNWKLVKTDKKYPPYESLRKEFVIQWDSFLKFLDLHKIEPPKLNQWEVTYLNHIPQGTVWDSPQDWGFFRSLNPLPPEEDLLHLESFGGEWHFVIPENRGRLHVKWSHTYSSDKKQLIVLNLTARGAVSSTDTVDLIDGLDLGRQQIVDSFQRLMSPSANQDWGLENGNS